MFANHLDFQDRLDFWAQKVNSRTHRTLRAVPAERLAQERQRRALGQVRPGTDRRFVVRVAQQPLVRVDRNDYSIDPRFAGRRVEVRVSQREITATVLDTGELAARHRRVFAGGLTLVATRPTRTSWSSSAADAANPTRSRSSNARWLSMTR